MLLTAGICDSFSHKDIVTRVVNPHFVSPVRTYRVDYLDEEGKESGRYGIFKKVLYYEAVCPICKKSERLT